MINVGSVGAIFGSIPSPPSDTLHLGPVDFRLYGLLIAIAAIVGTTIADRRWHANGGQKGEFVSIAVWAIPAGVIGARLYHVATDWKAYRNDWPAALDIGRGGLGIPGGIMAGVLVGVFLGYRRHLPVARGLDMVAPAFPVAQAIGRLGNYFNQELFGRPTDLPWGLEVDPAFRSGFFDVATFHPTFLYEALWNLALAAGLVLLDRRRILRPGELFNLYVLGYAIGRLWVEELRIDPASLVFGVRVNLWTSGLTIVGALAVFIWRRRRSEPVEPGPIPGETSATA